MPKKLEKSSKYEKYDIDGARIVTGKRGQSRVWSKGYGN